MLYWFLRCNNRNEPVYIGSLQSLPPHPTPLGHHRASAGLPVWDRSCIHQFSISTILVKPTITFFLCYYNNPLTCLPASSSCCLVCSTSGTVARQPPLSMRFPRQEYWSGLPLPSPGIFPTQGLNPQLLHWVQWFLYHWATKEAPPCLCLLPC